MDVKLPNLGEGSDSGTVVSIFVSEGDSVRKDQPILELENEKAVASVPSTGDGIVAKLFVKPGDKLSVGQRILSIRSESPVGQSTAPAASPDDSETQRPPQRIAERGDAAEAESGNTRETGETISNSEFNAGVVNPNPAASPSIRKLTRELGVELRRVRGSGRGGRVTMEDLKAYIAALQARAFKHQPDAAASVSRGPRETRIDYSKWGPVSRKPLSSLRKVISRRMFENWTTIPHVTQFDEADISGLMELRKKHATVYQAKGARLTLTAFALKAVCAVLKMHPLFNSSLDEASAEIVLKEYFHIGVAVDTEAGLIVPVIRNADRKSLIELSKDLEALAEKARERKVAAEELKGGTFTISNQGGIGSSHFTPIVNKPEVAILGLGRGAIKPVFATGNVVPRTVLPISVSYDHRVIDGGTAARFTVDLVNAFESFSDADVAIE